MRLDGPGGRSLELAVIGCEYPSMITSEEGPYDDANWLVIDVAANDGARTWAFRSPWLLTTELAGLAGWFQAVADGWVELDQTDFLEPVLAFRRISSPADEPVIRVTFDLEARPPWAPSTGDEDNWGAYSLEFPLTAESVGSVARDLRSDLERFPERGRRSH